MRHRENLTHFTFLHCVGTEEGSLKDGPESPGAATRTPTQRAPRPVGFPVDEDGHECVSVVQVQVVAPTSACRLGDGSLPVPPPVVAETPDHVVTRPGGTVADTEGPLDVRRPRDVPGEVPMQSAHVETPVSPPPADHGPTVPVEEPLHGEVVDGRHTGHEDAPGVGGVPVQRARREPVPWGPSVGVPVGFPRTPPEVAPALVVHVTPRPVRLGLGGP